MIYREKEVFGSEEIIQTNPNLYLTEQKYYTGWHTLNGVKQFVLGEDSKYNFLFCSYTHARCKRLCQQSWFANKSALNMFIRANNISLASDTVFTKISFAK